MQTNQLQPKTKNKKGKYIGRGGKRGTYSGRGVKGQKARAGRKLRPEIRDMIKKLPKKRGYRFKSFQTRPIVINLDVLNKIFNDNDQITPKILVEKVVIKSIGGRLPTVKILDGEELGKKFNVSGCQVSKSVKEKIEKAGGSVKTNVE